MKESYPLFITTDHGVFMLDKEDTTDNCQVYKTRFKGEEFRINRVGFNGPIPYYELFHDYEELYNGKRRQFSSTLFCSSSLEKMINFINTYL